MGQQRLSDLESVDFLCSHIRGWGEILAYPRHLVQRPEPVRVFGKSFNGELSLIWDRGKEDGSFAIEISLRRLGPGRHRERYLQVSYDHAARRLDFPKEWRRVTALAKVRKRKHRRLLWSIHLTREVYWAVNVPAEDLKAQITVALVQLDCIQHQAAQVWIAGYLQQTFRFSLRNTSKPERASAREGIAYLSAESLINAWHFPEDYRAFRLYVKATIRCASRMYLGPADRVPCSSNGLTFEFEDGDKGTIEPSRDGRDNHSNTWQSSLGFAGVVCELKEKMSVADAAEYVHRSEGYIYRLLREGRIRNVGVGERLELAGDDVDHINKILIRRQRLRTVRHELEANGRTKDAARKATYRQFGRAPQV